jgi:hypothetical protein
MVEVIPPVFQLYEAPPEAVRITGSPMQTMLEAVVAVIDGSAFTVTVAVAAPEHPSAL